MKVILGLILCLCFVGVSKGQILLGTDIAVKISVEAENSKIKENLSKDLAKILPTLNNDIVIVGGEGSYLIKIQVMEIKSLSNAEPQYAISTIITAKEYAESRRNKASEVINQFLDSKLVISSADQLKDQINEIAAFANSQIHDSENSKYLRRKDNP